MMDTTGVKLFSGPIVSSYEPLANRRLTPSPAGIPGNSSLVADW
ncbi:MAG TPA: hypothetical protein PLL71_01770 [Agriterribacter sp.]|nr:hypothetical protein [Agriterribacter sp.]HRQ49009.1 hypothetical protein [Agriterribacter sp.]